MHVLTYFSCEFRFIYLTHPFKTCPPSVSTKYLYDLGNFLMKAFRETESKPNMSTFSFKAVGGRNCQPVRCQMRGSVLIPVSTEDHLALGDSQLTATTSDALNL